MHHVHPSPLVVEKDARPAMLPRVAVAASCAVVAAVALLCVAARESLLGRDVAVGLGISAALLAFMALNYGVVLAIQAATAPWTRRGRLAGYLVAGAAYGALPFVALSATFAAIQSLPADLAAHRYAALVLAAGGAATGGLKWLADGHLGRPRRRVTER